MYTTVVLYAEWVQEYFAPKINKELNGRLLIDNHGKKNQLTGVW